MKKNLTKVMTLGMVLTMLGATAVFANETAETTAATIKAINIGVAIAAAVTVPK